jgi:hypothetical protein
MAKKNEPRKRGPRGGRTTVSRDGQLVRKAFWLHPEEAGVLRLKAFQDNRSEASFVREVLREKFGLAPLPEPGRPAAKRRKGGRGEASPGEQDERAADDRSQ